MLARSGRLPVLGGFSYEVKWDGFRAIVSTEGSLRVRNRPGWDMTPQLRFLAQLPVRAVLDGEVVAFGADGKPDFPLVCKALLHRDSSVPLTFVAFDVISIEGRKMCSLPYSERRRILDQMAWYGHSGVCRRLSRTGTRCGKRCASTSLRALLRSVDLAATSRVSAAGSKSRTEATGGMS